jgi:hypothetical protein
VVGIGNNSRYGIVPYPYHVASLGFGFWEDSTIVDISVVHK